MNPPHRARRLMQSISSLNLANLLLDAVCIVQMDSTIVFVSAAFERIFGYKPEEVIGKRMLDMVHPDDLPATQRQAQSVTQGELQLQFENRYVRKDGSIAHIRWTARWLPDRQVRLAVAHDITERKAAESMQAVIYAISEAAHTTHNLQALFQHIHQIVGGLLPATNFAVALYDALSDRLSFPYHVNEYLPAPATMALADDARYAEVIRGGATLLLTPDAPMAHALGGEHQPLYWLGVPLQTQRGPLGALVLQSYTEQGRYTDKDKELLQFVSTQVAAAIERKQMYERLEHMAQYDQLTHLPNRQLFLDRLKTALTRVFNEFGRAKGYLKEKDENWQGSDVREGMIAVVSVKLQEAQFEGQTKAKLGNTYIKTLVSNIVYNKLSEFLEENPQPSGDYDGDVPF